MEQVVKNNDKRLLTVVVDSEERQEDGLWSMGVEPMT